MDGVIGIGDMFKVYFLLILAVVGISQAVAKAAANCHNFIMAL